MGDRLRRFSSRCARVRTTWWLAALAASCLSACIEFPPLAEPPADAFAPESAEEAAVFDSGPDGADSSHETPGPGADAGDAIADAADVVAPEDVPELDTEVPRDARVPDVGDSAIVPDNPEPKDDIVVDTPESDGDATGDDVPEPEGDATGDDVPEPDDDGVVIDALESDVAEPDAVGTLDAPGLVAPPDGAAKQPRNPVLEWSEVDGAVGYRVFLAGDASVLAELPIDATVCESCQVADVTASLTFAVPAGALAASTTYFWKVRAEAEGLVGVDSDVWSFATFDGCGSDADCDDDALCVGPSTCAAGTGECSTAALPGLDDGVECTEDACDEGTGAITHAPVDASCDDDAWCNGEETCDEVEGCQPGTAPEVDDVNACTEDACDEEADSVTHLPDNAKCDDADACTEDECDPDDGCVHGESAPCDDEDACTDDACDPSTGCTHGTLATPCEDGNACTDDACDPSTGCTYAPNALPCGDGKNCTVDDVCSNAACHGDAKDCDDQNACTLDACSEEAGCLHDAAAKDASGCSDGDLCTANDVCLSGKCAGVPVDCPAGTCEVAACDSVTGECVTSPAKDGTACDDDVACTKGDACAEGTCSGAEYPCDDTLACTTDVCLGDGACTHTPEPASCVIDGACVAAGAVEPGSPCTGCFPAASASAWTANDGLTCGALPGAATTKCASGACVVKDCAPDRASCDDDLGNGCEIDTAVDPANCGGCTKPCTADQVCSSGSCIAACAPPTQKCGQSCLDTTSDPSHCGSCEKVCVLDNVSQSGCDQGLCTIGSCAPGFGDANHLASDGCECTKANDGVEQCNGADDDCNGVADDAAPETVAADPLHCGSCAKVCPAGTSSQLAACGGGTCGLGACPNDTWNLDGKVQNGCEYACIAAGGELCNQLDEDCDGVTDEGFDLKSDTAHCGACDTPCSHASVASWACVSGGCVIVACAPDTKDLDKAALNGCEAAYVPNGELWVDSFNGGDPAMNGSKSHPFDTIPLALSAAFTGYTIHVLEGVYTGGFTVSTPGVKLSGASVDSVIVAAPAGGTGITVSANDVTVEGLNVDGGATGVRWLGTAAVPVMNGVASDLTITNASGSGLRIEYAPAAHVTSVAVSGMKSAGALLGVLVDHSDGANLLQVTVSGLTTTWASCGNDLGGTYPAGVRIAASSGVVLANSSVQAITGSPPNCNQRNGGAAVGIELSSAPKTNIVGCSIAGLTGGVGANNSSYGGGGECAAPGGVTRGIVVDGSSSGSAFSDTTISGIAGGTNGVDSCGDQFATGSQPGYGISFSAGPVAVTIAPSVTVGGEPVVYLYGADGATVSGYVLTAKNTTTNLGKIVVAASKNVKVLGNTIAGVYADTGCSGYTSCAGGDATGIRVSDCAGCEVANNDVSGITGGTGGAGKYLTAAASGGVASAILLAGNCSGTTVHGNTLHGVVGGRGGKGVPSTSGSGGRAVGVRLATSGVSLFENTITNVTGGKGGVCQSGGAMGGVGAGLTVSTATTGNSVATTTMTTIVGGAGQQGFGVYFESGATDVKIAPTTTLNGDPVLYLYGATAQTLSGHTITASGNPTNLGKIAVFKSSAVVVSDNTIATFAGETGCTAGGAGLGGCNGTDAAGVRLDACADCIVSGNAISGVTGGSGGLGGHLPYSTQGSGGSGGVGAGIALTGACKGTSVTGNTIGTIKGGSGGGGGGYGSGGATGAAAGVRLGGTTGVTVSGNTMTGAANGVYFDSGALDVTVDPSNTLDGDPVLYLYGATGVTLSGYTLAAKSNPTNLGKIAVIQSTGVVIKDNTVSGFTGAAGCSGGWYQAGCAGSVASGILLQACATCSVSGNVVSGITAGHGGVGGGYGTSGSGGAAAGIRLVSSTAFSLADNTVTGILGGQAGGAGGYGSGGNGGDGVAILVSGGSGTMIQGSVLSATGGAGTAGYSGKAGGSGGTGVGLDLANTSVNTVAHVAIYGVYGGAAGSGSPAGSKGGAAGVRATKVTSLKLVHLSAWGIGAAGTAGHAVRLAGGQASGVTLTNSILSTTSGPCLFSDATNAATMLSVSSSLAFGCTGGTSTNVTIVGALLADDPLFVDPSKGNLHVGPGSPAIDSGKTTSDYCEEPSPNGCRVDLGAYGNTPEATSNPLASQCDCEP